MEVRLHSNKSGFKSLKHNIKPFVCIIFRSIHIYIYKDAIV